MHHKLKSIRLAAGLTEANVAQRLGMAPSTYHKLESGVLRLRVEHLLDLHSLYNLPIDEIILGDEVPPLGVGRWVMVYAIAEAALIETGEVFGAPGPTSANAFAVIMGDASMSPAIHLDDRLLIDPDREPHNGSTVLTKVSTGEIIVRRITILHPSDARAPGYILRPNNQDFPEIIQRADECKILGTVSIRQEWLE